jgi:hypothetical protein
MNSSIYAVLDAGETIVGQFDPPPMGGMRPTAELHFGKILQDQRITLSFASLEQIELALAEMADLRDQWRSRVHAQRMTDMATARDQAAS